MGGKNSFNTFHSQNVPGSWFLLEPEQLHTSINLSSTHTRDREPCLSTLLEILALAGSTHNLGLISKSNLGKFWELDEVFGSCGLCVSEDCFHPPPKHTTALIWIFLRQCHPPHWYFTELRKLLH